MQISTLFFLSDQRRTRRSHFLMALAVFTITLFGFFNPTELPSQTIEIEDDTFYRGFPDIEPGADSVYSNHQNRSWIVLLHPEWGNDGGAQSDDIGGLLNNLNPNLLQLDEKSGVKKVFSKNLLQVKADRSASLSEQQSASRLSRYYLVTGDENLDKLKASGVVSHYEENRKFRIEQVEEGLVGEVPWHFPMLNIFAGWENTMGKGVEIAVIDTGIEMDHEELDHSMAINALEDANQNGTFEPWPLDSVVDGVSGDLNGLDDDGNGYTDDVIGYDFVDLDMFDLGDSFESDPLPFDEQGHGTTMSSLIAAKADGKKITGVAPEAKLITIRSFDSRGNGEADDIANGIVYAVARGAKIINMSFGDNFESLLVRDAIRYAHSSGTLMVSSAGNSGSYFRAFPSDYQEVLSISGITESGTKYGRGNFGSMIDLSAPSVELSSAGLNNSYKLSTGTSGAAAIVSGMAALALANNPKLNASQLRSLILNSAEDYGTTGWDQVFGYGVPNAAKLMDDSRDLSILFNSPRYGEVFASDEVIGVNATIISPLLESWELSYSAGWGVDIANNTPEWKLISSSDIGGIGIDIGEFTTGSVGEEQITLRILVNQTNGISKEKRIYLSISEGDNTFSYLRDSVYNVYTDGQPGYMAFYSTSQESEILAQIGEDSKGALGYSLGDAIWGNYHLLDIVKPTLNEDYEMYVRSISGSDSIEVETSFTTGSKTFSKNEFDLKSYSIPFSYLKGEPYSYQSELYVPATDYGGLSFGETKLYTFTDDSFLEKYSALNVGLVRGAADMDGDGAPEILTTIDFGAEIYTHGKGGNPFDSRVYETELTDRLWGLEFVDLDEDGDFEALLIGSADENISGLANTIVIVDYVDNRFQNFYLTPMQPIDTDEDGMTDTLTFHNDLQNESVALDINSNGNTDLVLADFDGIVYVYEIPKNYRTISGSEIVPLYHSKKAINSSDHYFVKGDFIGDNGLDVAIMGYGQSAFTGGIETANHDASNVRLLSFEEEFKLSTPYYFRNSRNNLGLHWGVSGGNFTDADGDELIVNAFPYSYFFGKATSDTLEPISSIYGVLSRSALIYDFDDNGKNEILLNTFDQTYALEFNASNVAVPELNWISMPQPNTVSMSWYPTKEGRYLVGYIEDGQINILQETTTNSILINGLDSNTDYQFTVASVGNNGNGPFSEPLSINTAPSIFPLTITKQSDLIYKVKYTGYLPNTVNWNQVFFMQEQKGYYPRYSQSDGDSILIMHFDNPVPEGGLILFSRNFQDNRGLPATFTQLTYINENNTQNDDFFTLVSAELIGNGSLLELRFSENVTMDNNISEAQFILRPSGELFNIGSSLGDSLVLQANVSSDIRRNGKGFEYCVEVTNLVSDRGLAINGTLGNKACFSIPVDNLEDVFAYPQPWDTSISSEMVFSNIVNGAKVTVVDITGNIIAEIVERDNNGGVEWNGQKQDGSMIEPGVYFYRVSAKDANGLFVESQLSKFAVTK